MRPQQDSLLKCKNSLSEKTYLLFCNLSAFIRQQFKMAKHKTVKSAISSQRYVSTKKIFVFLTFQICYKSILFRRCESFNSLVLYGFVELHLLEFLTSAENLHEQITLFHSQTHWTATGTSCIASGLRISFV